MVAAIIIACTKEKEAKVAHNNRDRVAASKEDDMSAYLEQFKEKMQSASKSDETLSLEDARWHLEAVLNYTYGDAGHEISDIQCDTFYYELHTGGDEVTLAQLNEAFNALSINVEKVFANCDLPDKSILAIQTRFEDEHKNGDIIVRVIMDTRGLRSGSNMLQFGPIDYWYEDDRCGKCGPYVGECLGTGSVQRLQFKINLCIPQTECNIGSGYYTDIELVEINDSFIYNYLEDTLDLSPCGYRIHYYGDFEELFPLCLSPDDLNYYLVEALKLIDELRPEDKVIIDMTNVYYDLVPAEYYFGYHHYTFKYGVLNCNGGGGGYDY